MWKQKLLQRDKTNNQHDLHIYNYFYDGVQPAKESNPVYLTNKIQELQSQVNQFQFVGNLQDNVAIYRLEKNDNVFSCAFICQYSTHSLKHSPILGNEKKQLNHLYQLVQKYQRKEIAYNDYDYDTRSLIDTMKCFNNSPPYNSDPPITWAALLFAHPNDDPQNVEFISSASGLYENRLGILDNHKFNTAQITFVGNLSSCMRILNPSRPINNFKSTLPCIGTALLISLCFRVFTHHGISVAYLANEAKEKGYICYASAAYACEWQPYGMNVGFDASMASKSKISDCNVSFYLLNCDWTWLIPNWNHRNEEAHFMYFVGPVLLINEHCLLILSHVIMDVQPWLNRHQVFIHQHVTTAVPRAPDLATSPVVPP